MKKKTKERGLYSGLLRREGREGKKRNPEKKYWDQGQSTTAQRHKGGKRNIVKQSKGGGEGGGRRTTTNIKISKYTDKISEERYNVD